MSNAVCIVIGNSAEIGLEKTKGVLSFLFEHGATATHVADALLTSQHKFTSNLFRFLVRNRVEIMNDYTFSILLENYHPNYSDEIIRYMITGGIDANLNVRGMNVLTVLCQNEDKYDVINYVIDSGARINSLTDHGYPIVIAYKRKDFKLVRLLLDRGAAPEKLINHVVRMESADHQRVWSLLKLFGIVLIIDRGAANNPRLRSQITMNLNGKNIGRLMLEQKERNKLIRLMTVEK